MKDRQSHRKIPRTDKENRFCFFLSL